MSVGYRDTSLLPQRVEKNTENMERTFTAENGQANERS